MKYVVNKKNTRYFAGIELIGGLKLGSEDYQKIPKLWSDLLEVYIKDIPNQIKPNNCIGLEMYRFDFMESRTMDYYALIEISELFDCEEDLVTKKLPKGSYISFEISFDNIRDEVERVYNFVKKEQINVHLGFDVEEYIPGQDYTKPGAKLYLTFKLDE